MNISTLILFCLFSFLIAHAADSSKTAAEGTCTTCADQTQLQKNESQQLEEIKKQVANGTSGNKIYNYDFKAMERFLTKLKSNMKLPSRQCESDEQAPANEPIPQMAKEIFTDLQLQVFGTDKLISLKTCSDCAATSDYATRTVYVQPSTIKKIIKKYGDASGRVVLKYILAHEFSHFIQEASIGAGNTKDASLNGAHSVYVRNPKYDNAAEGLRAHAEVDAYALLVLRQSFRNKPSVILDFMNDEQSEIKSGSDEDKDMMVKDFSSRIQQASSIMQQLWSH